jgi:hypothetical protein
MELREEAEAEEEEEEEEEEEGTTTITTTANPVVCPTPNESSEQVDDTDGSDAKHRSKDEGKFPMAALVDLRSLLGDCAVVAAGVQSQDLNHGIEGIAPPALCDDAGLPEEGGSRATELGLESTGIQVVHVRRMCGG